EPIAEIDEVVVGTLGLIFLRRGRTRNFGWRRRHARRSLGRRLGLVVSRAQERVDRLPGLLRRGFFARRRFRLLGLGPRDAQRFELRSARLGGSGACRLRGPRPRLLHELRPGWLGGGSLFFLFLF